MSLLSDGEADIREPNRGAFVHHHLRHPQPDPERDGHEGGDHLQDLLQPPQRHRLPPQRGPGENRLVSNVFNRVSINFLGVLSTGLDTSFEG